MTPSERAQRIRQESESAGETVEFLLLAVSQLVADLAGSRSVTVTGEARRPGREPLLDVYAAAEHIAVSPRTLREWAQKGRVRYTRIGNELRFRHEDLLRVRPAARRAAR